MKTHLNYSQNKNINNNMLAHKRKNLMQQGLNKQANTMQNYNRPAQAISFGGSAGLNKGFTKAFNKTVEFVNDNEAAYNAIYSLIVAGMLKPLFVLNMPGSEEKDKQIVATKNFLQAFLGSFLSLTIGGGFIKKAIDVVKTNLKLFKVDDDNNLKVFSEESTKVLEVAKEALIKEGKEPTIDEIKQKAKHLIGNFNKNHKDAFEQNTAFLKLMKSGAKNAKSGTSYQDAFEVFWKNSTGALTAIGKAKISSLLLPGVMAFLFAKKNAQKEAEQKAKENTLSSNLVFRNEQQQFQRMMNKNANPSFKGNLLDSAIDGGARLIEKAGLSQNFGEPVTKFISKFKKPSARMSDFESFAITAYWLQNTARSKKIDPSQKLGLNVHSALVTVVSSTAAFIIDWALDGLIDKSKASYKTKLNEIAESVQNMPLGENLDTVLEEYSDVVKMGIKDEVVKILDSKHTKESIAKITDEDITKIIDSLKQTKSFEGINLKKDLIERVARSLEKSEPIRKQILDSCSDMIGAQDVAKNLARAIAGKEDVTKEIAKLTSKYGRKLSKFKSLTVFTLVVRFLVPVLMVPFSGKLKKKIIEWTDGKPNTPKTAKA